MFYQNPPPSMYGSSYSSMFGGVPRFLGNHSNALMQLGLGILSGQTPQDGFGNAAKGLAVGVEQDQTAADKKRQAEDEKRLREALAGLSKQPNSPLAGPYSSLMQAYPEATAKGLIERQLGGSDQSSLPQYGVQPIYGVDEQGNPAILQLSQSGQPIQTPLPKGFQLAPGAKNVDLGTSVGILDRTGQIINNVPKDIAGEQRQQEIGKVQGQAEASIPAVQQAADLMTSMIQDVRNDPNRASSTGWQAPMNAVPGTSGYGFQKKSDQLRGQAFMQAYQTLRGAGAISEKEGQAATDAITRLDTAMSDADYLKALDDLQAIVNSAVAKQQKKAGMGDAADDDPLGIR